MARKTQSYEELRAAIDQAVASDNAFAEATARVNLAAALQSQNDPSAFAAFESALSAARRSQSVRSEAILLLNFIPRVLELGDANRALALAERAVEITARAQIDHRFLALLELGRVWVEGFRDAEQGRATLRAAADVFDEYQSRDNVRAREIAAAMEPPLTQACKAALEIQDTDLALRLAAIINPDEARRIASISRPTNAVPDLAQLREKMEPEYDELLSAWRAARTVGRRAHPESLPPQLREAVGLLAQGFGWDDIRARAASPPNSIDEASATRGGAGGMLSLADDMAAGRLTADNAEPLARQLGLSDDDFAFLIAVPGRAPERGSRILGPLLELIGRVARDDVLGARCLRVLSAFASGDGQSVMAENLLDRAARRLTSGADDALRAEVLNEQSVALSGRGAFREAIEKAQQARAVALDWGNHEIARMALGNIGHALLGLGDVRQALQVFERLIAEQEAAQDAAGLAQTRFNIAAARAQIGEIDEGVFRAGSSDPDHAFMAAYTCALKGDIARAIDLYQVALKALDGKPPYGREAEARKGFAEVLIEANRAQEAAEELRVAAKLFEKRADTRGLIAALCRLASPDLAPLPAAHANATYAVKLAQKTGDPDLLADALTALGTLEILRKRAADGVEALQQAVAIAPTPERELALAEALVKSGHAERALPILNLAVDSARSGNPRDLIVALGVRAEALDAIQRRAEALQDLREANESASDLQVPELIANVQNRYGWALIEIGAVADGISHLEDALEHARVAGAVQLETAILNNLGMGLNESGDPVGARASFEAARKSARVHSDLGSEAIAVFGLGNVAMSEHRRSEAHTHYRETAGMAEQVRDARLEATAADSLAVMHLQAGEPAKAIDLHKRAATLHAELGQWADQVADLANLISAYVLLREAQPAADTLREARAVVRSRNLGQLHPILRLNTAQIDALRGDWIAARKGYRAAIRAFELEQAQFSTPAAQRRWRSRRVNAYELAVEDAVQAGDAEAAVEFMESNRTRFFEDILLRRGARPAHVGEEVMHRYELAADRLDELQRQRRASIGQRDENIERALARARAEFESLRQMVAADGDTAPQSRPPPFKFAPFASLAKAVPCGHTVVAISLHNRGTVVVCAGRDDAGLPWSSAGLEPALDRSRMQELVFGDTDAWRHARTYDDIPDSALGWAVVSQIEAPQVWQRALAHLCRELGTLLWPAIERVLDGRTTRLVLMPGAGFAVLPLHAACLADGTRAQDRFELRYAPSFKLLQRASSARILGPHPSLGQVVPPESDLPFASLEAARVAKRLGVKRPRLPEGQGATPDATLGLFSAVDIFHFSGHGAFDSAEPLRSRLVCAAADGKGRDLLTVRRLIERTERVRCGLAILSACETGRVEASDALNDALGLSGALLAAGCGGVMATFWPVRDLAACLVLDRTLEIWNTERGPLPTALAAATRWLREATADTLVEHLKLWERDHPDYAPLLDDYIGRLATYQRRPPFEDEINWAPFHLVGNPELPRRA